MNLRKYIREILENASNLWINGGILLIKGKLFEDGTQPLYAVHIVNLMQVDRKKKDETEGVPAKMAILGEDLYRVILDNGKLRTAKVDWKNIGSLSKTLKFGGRQAHAVVLNNKKTPLHWESLKYNYFPKMFAEIGDEIMNIPNIKLTFATQTMNENWNNMKDEKIVYEAYFVEEPSRLKQEFPPVYPNTFYHHMTIAFGPKELKMPNKIGERTKLKVIGRITTDKVDALLVETDISNNKYPHITLSTAEGVKPFESNNAFEKHPDQIEYFDSPIYVDARYGYFNGRQDVNGY